MRGDWLIVVALSLVAFESWARIGDSLKGLEERYGTPKETKQKDGGLVVVQYDKDGLKLFFSLLDDKTEEVDIQGDLSEKEAEVFLARNVPTGTTFSVNDNPLVPLIFRGTSYKEYSFSDKTTAYLVGVGGQKQLVIKTPKMTDFEVWQAENEKKKELAKANQRADKIESRSIQSPPAKKDESVPSFQFFIDRSSSEVNEKLTEKANSIFKQTTSDQYRKKLYLAIGSRWNSKVSQLMSQIGVDRVVFRFRIKPDGSISREDIESVQGNPNSILGLLAADSIQQASNLVGAFPESLKNEEPDGFEWQIEFKIQ